MVARDNLSPWQPTFAPAATCPHCGSLTAYDETRVVGTLHLHSWQTCDCAVRGKRILTIQRSGPAWSQPVALLPATCATSVAERHAYAVAWNRRANRAEAVNAVGAEHVVSDGAVMCLHGPYQPLLLPARATVRVFSFGGGVQSHAVLALQALGKLHNPYDVYVFANVGADSENPETLDYIERYTKPFCEKHGIKFVEVQKQRGRGKAKEPTTLLEAIYRDNKSIPIPAYMSGSGAPGNRSCTEDFKIAVVDKWIKGQGFGYAVIGLGISVDELRRVKHTAWHDRYREDKPFGFWKRREYQLVDLRVSRVNCYAPIEAVGLPEPPPSACWFCPFRKLHKYAEMSLDEPDQFQAVIGVETRINEKRELAGKDSVWLSDALIPIDVAVAEHREATENGQLALWPVKEPDFCDEGVCMV